MYFSAAQEKPSATVKKLQNHGVLDFQDTRPGFISYSSSQAARASRGCANAHIKDDLADNLDPAGWSITLTIITTMNANTPPPLPPEQIRCVRFEGEKMGLHTANFDRTRLEMAQQKALQWMSANPSAEIISVDSCFGNLIVIVTVWYRP
jgi:hypothetical protein